MKSDRIFSFVLLAALLLVPGVLMAHPGHSVLDPTTGVPHPGHEAELAKILIFVGVTALLIGARHLLARRS